MIQTHHIETYVASVPYEVYYVIELVLPSLMTVEAAKSLGPLLCHTPAPDAKKLIGKLPPDALRQEDWVLCRTYISQGALMKSEGRSLYRKMRPSFKSLLNMKSIILFWAGLVLATLVLAFKTLKFEDARWLNVVLVVAGLTLYLIGRKNSQKEFFVFSAICSISVILHQVYAVICILISEL